MLTQEQVGTLVGRDVHDRTGDKIGSIGQIWADVSGRPTWASVKTGLFGLKESLLPLQDADLQGDTVTVPFEKSQVKDAPNVDISHDEPLTQDEVDLLYRHYNISWDDSAQAYQTGAEHARSADFTGAGTGTAGSGRADYDTDRTDYDTERTGVNRGDDAMTRSEERLNVGTQQEQVGKARLRKYVVTEQQQVNVPVSREEVRLEREPVTEANRGDAFDGPDITESEHEVTLRAERPVVDTETVPVERVRLGKETVTEEQTVGGEVRKERIEADLPDEGRRNLD
jgi:uncharacterized protein (TIGR02271 family)